MLAQRETWLADHGKTAFRLTPFGPQAPAARRGETALPSLFQGEGTGALAQRTLGRDGKLQVPGRAMNDLRSRPQVDALRLRK
jgi:hypothetical protein